MGKSRKLTFSCVIWFTIVPRVVPNVLKSKSMMFELSKTVSTVLRWYFDKILQTLEFCWFSIFENAILWLYSQNMSSGYHFGYHRHLFSKISSKICFRKKTLTLSRNIYFYALDFVFFTNFTNIDVCHIFICRSIREYSMTMKIFSSKSMASRLSNALSNASIAFLVPEKLALELVKLTQ